MQCAELNDREGHLRAILRKAADRPEGPDLDDHRDAIPLNIRCLSIVSTTPSVHDC